MAAGLDDLDTRELLARAEVTVRLEAERRQRRVFLSRTDEHGLRTMVARIEAGDAVWIDATVDRVADHLLAHPALRRAHHPDLPEEVTKAELRAEALGWLARPHDLAALLGAMGTEEAAAAPDLAAAPAPTHPGRPATTTPPRSPDPATGRRRTWATGSSSSVPIGTGGPPRTGCAAPWTTPARMDHRHTDGVGFTPPPTYGLGMDAKRAVPPAVAAAVGGLLAVALVWSNRPESSGCTTLETGARACMPTLVVGPPLWLYAAVAVGGAVIAAGLWLAACVGVRARARASARVP